jgi:hypothetical protein
MRYSKLLILLFALLLPFAVACGHREGAETQNQSAMDTAGATSEAEIPGTGSPNDVSPVKAEMAIDDVTVGSGLNADGSIDASHREDDFTPGQPVYVAMKVGDAPAGSAVKVTWYNDAGNQKQDTAAAGDATTDKGGTKVGEDTKTVAAGQTFMNFQAPDTKSWAKGDYRVEVWFGDEKVAEEQFQIVDKKDAAT